MPTDAVHSTPRSAVGVALTDIKSGGCGPILIGGKVKLSVPILEDEEFVMGSPVYTYLQEIQSGVDDGVYRVGSCISLEQIVGRSDNTPQLIDIVIWSNLLGVLH